MGLRLALSSLTFGSVVVSSLRFDGQFVGMEKVSEFGKATTMLFKMRKSVRKGGPHHKLNLKNRTHRLEFSKEKDNYIPKSAASSPYFCDLHCL